jgi:hypothetical protein
MKTMGRLRAMPRATWMLFGASAVATVTAVALMFTPGGPRVGVVDAHLVPEGCDPGVGSSSAQIDAPGTIPPVVEGQLINYRLRVGYPNDGVQDLCQAFNVDVWIKLPGAASYQLACTFPEINEGETLQCPDFVPYTAEGADRTAGVLQAFLFAIGDKHDQEEPNDCITSPDNPNTGVGPICFGIQVTSNIGMPDTPTPTPTNTPTNTPTSTPTNTPVTPSVTPNPSHTPEKNTPVKHSSPTRTPSPSTPTAVNTTLPATVAPQPTNTPVGVTLPPAGGGGSPMGDLSLPVAGLALMALILAGAGIVVAKRQGI